MYLTKHITPDQIMVQAKARDKWDLMRQMLDRIVRSPSFRPQDGVTRESLWQALEDREKKLSTGIGGGFALPHARMSKFAGTGLALAILEDDLEYESIDGQPVRIVCMVITSDKNPTMALKVSSAIVSLLAEQGTAEFLRNTKNAEEIYDFLCTKELKLEVVVTCKDIMRPPFFKVHPETPLSQLTHFMMRYREEATAVLDQKDTVIGEITCDLLFQFGLPDFFNQLKSVSFISRFDPFEKYFENESKAVSGDIMSKKPPVIAETSTLLEIVFELTVRRRPKLYVVREGQFVGVIDRSVVLDRVVNF